MSRGAIAFILFLGACSPAPSPPPAPPPTNGEPTRPDAKGLSSLILDPRCTDTCCLSRREWIGTIGPPPAKEDVDAARGALRSSNEARVRALAARVIARGLEPTDAELLDKIVDDERNAGNVPTERLTQAMQQCYPVTWRSTTPSREALAALGRLHGTHFESRAAYRTWASAHADPDASFDVWVGRLGAQRPPPPELLERLRAKDPMLFVRVMVFTCDGNGGCGLSDAELAVLLKSKVGSKRAIAWLEQRERMPEWRDGAGQMYRSILAAGAEGLFTADDAPELHRLWEQRTSAHTIYTSMLGVLLSRLRPNDATTYFRELLDRSGSNRLAANDAAFALREIARRDPLGMEKEITKWFFPNGSKEDEPYASTAIWTGLSEAEPAKAAPVFARLVTNAKEIELSENEPAKALRRAAIRAGCTDLPDETALVASPLKNQRPEDFLPIKKKADAARAELLKKAKACAAGIRARKP